MPGHRSTQALPQVTMKPRRVGRAGWLLTPELSFGPELRYDNNLDSGGSNWSGCTGVFARYQREHGEISIAGGTVRQIESDGSDYGLYGMFNVLYQY
jgi:hypothetical protein